MKRFLVSVLLAGCAASPATRAAKSGDRVALATAARGVTNHEAASLAQIVADHELRVATPADAPQRVREAWSCAHELDGALAARMKHHDEAGADAALARLDGRGLDLDDVRDYLADADPRWRAVGVRGLVRPGDRDARVRALLDRDPHVRRQAARAAGDAADPDDLQPLADAARVDPEPIVRTEAVRAIAGLPPLPREEVADVLRDLWPAADDGLREDIALAWARPVVWATGGREALGVIVASSHGPGAIEAAAAVLRHADAEGEVVVAARAQILRALEQGPRAERLQAIAQAPGDRPEMRQALREAAAADDVEVRVAALARLAEVREPGAVEKLEAIASAAPPGSTVSARARLALASAGDRAVQSWLEQDMKSERAVDRLAAASGLASLHLAGRAAPLLADVDPGVRLRVACTILVAARVH
jgi:HEAT repeat protein